MSKTEELRNALSYDGETSAIVDALIASVREDCAAPIKARLEFWDTEDQVPCETVKVVTEELGKMFEAVRMEEG